MKFCLCKDLPTHVVGHGYSNKGRLAGKSISTSRSVPQTKTYRRGKIKIQTCGKTYFGVRARHICFFRLTAAYTLAGCFLGGFTNGRELRSNQKIDVL